jgi:DNA-binding MurR/RpiR family transcriptional regulator
MLRFAIRSASERSTGRSNQMPADVAPLCRRKGKANGEANQPAVTKTATKTRPAARTRTSHPTGRRTPTRPNGKALSTYITERFDEFSRSQKDVARYIVDHLDEAAFQTAEELARRASTSSSTVVRFSQALGFEGYPELQQAAIEEYRSRGPAENGAPPAPLFDFDHSEFEASLAADHANIEETVRNLTREQVEACVTALGGASRVMIVGMDQLAFFASYLRHLLALLDIRAEVVASPRQDSITRLSRVDEDALVIAFSAGRAHPIVVRAMKLAKHRGASTMAITDATLSDIGEHSDLTLYYSSNSPSFTRSNTSLLAIVQALAHGVYARDKGAYKDRIRAFKLK